MVQVIVVGGGLAGLSAAHTVLERGGRVLVIDKNAWLGGNSTKATSGINGALTKTQIKLGIPDTVDKFYQDTALSARDLIRPELVKVLTYQSASAVEWLQESFGLDLSLVSRLGGHSQPRTHRGQQMFPGMTITYALMERMEDIAKAEPHRARVIKKAKVTRLLTDSNKAVVGVEYEHEGKVFQEQGVVVLATGGYAADFADNGLIKQYRPDIWHLPTTNGDHSTGDGIKMVRGIGGNTVDLEKVQVHPTGLVDPNEPEAKVKFLAAEALRGVGGILLTRDGKRFCDELGHRDYVTGKMWEFKKEPYRLVLNKSAAKEIEWHCKHYMGRGLMKRFANGAALAREMGITPQALQETITQYNKIAETQKDPFGKKYFHNTPIDFNEEFYVSIVTPVVHYCMGGIEIGPDSEVKAGKAPIPGLFAAGELCGGVHGANRLGGSSLLGCVVFGRVAGNSASRYLMETLVNSDSASQRVGALAGQLTGSPFQTNISVDPSGNRVHFDISWNNNNNNNNNNNWASFSSSAASSAAPRVGPSAPTSSSASAPAAPQASSSAATPAASGAKDRNREITPEEVAKHKTENDCWVIVNGQVLDVTNFLKDHPGGKKAIMIYAGRDATEEFNMLHKSDVVEKYAPDSIIGRIKGGSAGHGGSSGGSGGSPAKAKVELKGSNVESWNSGGTADILPAERSKSTLMMRSRL